MLEKEIKTYEDKLPELLKTCPGRVVLIYEDQVVNVFDSESQALAEGARLLGLTSFLVRRVAETQVTAIAPALMLGILHAVV